jgi:signal peptidase
LLNKNESKVPGAVKDIAIVVIGVAVVWLGLRFAFGTNNPFYVVSSGSMVPTLNINDVLIVKDGTSNSFHNLKVGDIIVFHRPFGEDRVIVHRVAQIYNYLGQTIIRTKGDANPSSIPGVDYPIRTQQYIGKVVYVIPALGLLTKALSPPVNYIIIAVILVLLFFNRMGRRKDTETSQSSSPGTAGGTHSPPSPPPN